MPNVDATAEDLKYVTKDELEASICQDSFYEFVQRFWDVVIPEKPIWNWHIEVICDEMQKVAERVFAGLPKENDLLINVPPGSSKSTVCSIMFPAWVWTREPSFSTICGSYSYTLAVELSMKSRDIIQSDKYQRLWPDVQLRFDANRLDRFRNIDKGMRFTTSTGGTVTGFHGHFLIVDDPLNPQEAVSDAELKKANDWIGRTLSTRKVEKSITPTILIMQRLHEDDPSQNMLDKAEEGKTTVRHINLPAEYSEVNKNEVRPRSLRRRYTPDPDKEGWFLLDLQRMDRKVLEEAEAQLLEYGYAGQFLQRPVPLGGGDFDVDKMLIGEPPASDNDWVRKVRYWDKAGTHAGGCFTVGVLMGLDVNNFTWVLDVIRVQLNSWEREQLMKQTARLDGVDVRIGIEQEGGSGGKESAESTVRNMVGFNVEPDRVTGSKEERARPFHTQVNGGGVRLARADWNKKYKDELRMFPNSKYKDQVDASSGAFSMLSLTNTKRVGVW